MKTAACGAIALFLLALAPAVPGIELSVSEPGFLSIDGAYYGYGLRQPAPPGITYATIALLGADGFYLRTLLDTGTCQRSDGSAPTLAGPGTPRLRFADLPLAQSPSAEGLALATIGSGQAAALKLASCRGINVLHWRSADGDVSCGERIRFPFERGECPLLDQLDPNYISHGGFE
jgi:hypothetical protein